MLVPPTRAVRDRVLPANAKVGSSKLIYDLNATDGFGFRGVEDRVQVRDLQSTILHLLGLDHARLTYYFQDLKQRLI